MANRVSSRRSFGEQTANTWAMAIRSTRGRRSCNAMPVLALVVLIAGCALITLIAAVISEVF